MSDVDWLVLISLALVGEDAARRGGGDTDASIGNGVDTDAIAGGLVASGWDAEAIRAHALAELAAGRSWPHVVDPQARRGVSPAQFWAVLKDVRRSLGLETLTVAAPSRRTMLDADERRLMADLPPHHVAH